MRFSRLAAVCMLLSFGLLAPARGSAYCRTTTAEALASGCPETCQTAGSPLFWPKRSLRYVLNERGFPHLSDKLVRNILQRSFDTWTAVSCEGKPIDLQIVQSSGTTTLQAGPRELEPNDNAVAYIDAKDWDDEPRAFAITKIWYSERTGHILGADMLFNGHMDPFGVCPDPRGCTDDSITDLRNVVTHETGHFLGLAHSDDEGSTMWCDAAPGDIDKRDLGADDIAGICSIYGPSAFPGPPVSSSKSKSSGLLCSAGWAAPGPGLWGSGLALLGGLLALRRRRR